MNISLYSDVYQRLSNKQLSFNEFISGIKSGTWQDAVLQYRAGKAKKELIPCVTASGVFDKTRAASNLTKHSGIINIDIDKKDNEDVDLFEARSYLIADKFVYAGHLSVSGKGLSLYVKINPSKHAESFHALESYFANEYKIIIDKAAKDVSRLRFVSYDPDAWITPGSEKWIKYLDKRKVQPSNYVPIYNGSDIDYILQQIKQTGTDITADYNEWIKVGFALASEYGEQGRSMFHVVSSNHPNYDYNTCDKKYDTFLRSGGSGCGIASFFWIAKSAGLNIKTARTAKIESVAIARKQTAGKSGGAKNEADAKKAAKEYLAEIEGITDADDLIDKVFSLNNKQIEANETAISELEKLTNYIQTLSLRKNSITGRVELHGNDLTDRDLNTIFLNAKELYPKGKFAKQLISDLIESDRIKEFNPFLEFIEKNKHLRPKGVIHEFLDCIIIENNEYAKYVGQFIEKWMLSIIASIHGTYSLLILVLVGKQGTGKTNFFRYFLPDALQRYYAESKLDAGKDDEILMTQKLLIIDDEFGGKSKKEAAKLKDLASKQVFTNRQPYAHFSEDRQRIAVLGGTSNDIEILNDTTGNRRIIPVMIKDIDIERIKKVDKTELFIELYHKWRKVGDGWMLSSADIDALNQNTTEFLEIPMEEDLIAAYFEPCDRTDRGAEFYTTTQMITYCEERLGKQKIYVKKFGQILRKLGFERVVHQKLYGFWILRKDVT